MWIGSCVPPAIFSETSHPRKEIHAAEDRLRRQIESDRNDQAEMDSWICVEIDSGKGTILIG